MVVEGTPPPSYISSEGGGSRVVGGKETPPSHISSEEGPRGLVLEGPVSRLSKNQDWTGPRLEKTGPAVLVFQF